jgi:hypothetical protein
MLLALLMTINSIGLLVPHQDEIREIRQKLVKHQWESSDFESYLGAKCKSGMVLNFSEDTVQIGTCENNRMNFKTYKWTLTKHKRYYLFIKLDHGPKYLLTFPRNESKPCIILDEFKPSSLEETLSIKFYAS